MLQQARLVLKRGQPAPHTDSLDLAEVTPDFIATIDVKGHIVDCNPAARRILGLDETEPLDVHIADAHPAWANLLVLGEGIQTARLDGLWSGEAALLDRTGREIPVSEIILAHPRERDVPEYLTLIARDITAIKVAENALRASEQLYRRIVETVHAGIWIVDPDHRLTFVNPALAHCLGYRVDDMLGRSICAFLIEAEHASGPPEREFTLVRKDGTRLPVLLSTSPLFNSNEQFAGTLGIVLGELEYADE